MKSLIILIACSLSSCAVIEKSWKYHNRCEKTCKDWARTVDSMGTPSWMYDYPNNSCVCSMGNQVYIKEL